MKKTAAKNQIINIPIKEDIYVIGDIHGCAYELELMVAKLPLTSDSTIVFLGDYIDRGPDSKSVISYILELKRQYHVYPIMGNHEQMLIEYLSEPNSEKGARFIYNGGSTTLESYSTEPGKYTIPQDHLNFLYSLPLAYYNEEYFFVHAGVPDTSLDQLSPPIHKTDMLWIREKFLSSEFDWGKCIVHGHTPRKKVDILGNRVNLDTGCVFGNYLTAMHLPSHEIFQVKKQHAEKIRYLRDTKESTRELMRFQGSIRVSIWTGEKWCSYVSEDYSNQGLRVVAEPPSADSVLTEGEKIKGKIILSEDTLLPFEGLVVRVDSSDHKTSYGIQFGELLETEE